MSKDLSTGKNVVLLISAPSGAGKRTLLEKIAQSDANLVTAISATTRAPRRDELEAKDYYFLSKSEFDRRIAKGAFIEWAEVHENHYGTLREELERCLKSGQDVILELDVQGMRRLKKELEGLVTVFLMPPSMAELEARLRRRGTEDDAVVSVRLNNAGREMAARNEYDYVIVNRDVEEAARDLLAIVRAERCRAWRHA